MQNTSKGEHGMPSPPATAKVAQIVRSKIDCWERSLSNHRAEKRQTFAIARIARKMRASHAFASVDPAIEIEPSPPEIAAECATVHTPCDSARSSFDAAHRRWASEQRDVLSGEKSDETI